jgi:hypothetical protein
MKQVKEASLRLTALAKGASLKNDEGLVFNSSGSTAIGKAKPSLPKLFVEQAPKPPISITVEQVDALLNAQKKALESSFRTLAIDMMKAIPSTVVNTGKDVKQWTFDVKYGGKDEVRSIVAVPEYRE